MNEEQIMFLKETYQPGIRVRLISMEREPQMPAGLTGVVTMVDDIGQIHTRWQNGSSLALIVEVDMFIAFSGPTASEYILGKYASDETIWFRKGLTCYRAAAISVDQLIKEMERYVAEDIGTASELADPMNKPYDTVSLFDAFLSDHVLTEEDAINLNQTHENAASECERRRDGGT